MVRDGLSEKMTFEIRITHTHTHTTVTGREKMECRRKNKPDGYEVGIQWQSDWQKIRAGS